MNSKKVNRLFLVMVLVHLAVVFGLSIAYSVFSLSITANFIVSELIIAVPAFLFWMTAGEKRKELLPFHKIKFTSALMIILFTYLMMPLTTVLNAISMLFVDNAVAGISEEVLDMPFVVMFFMMAVYAPFMEELVFRGIVYRGYQQSGTIVQAISLSAVLFGLIHMNFNQAPYAFVLGIVLALLVEATGSIWASVLFHVVFNGNTVCLLFLTKNLFPEIVLEETSAQIGGVEWISSLCFYMVLASATTAIAVCVLAWIANNEGRLGHVKAIWKKRKEGKGKMLTVSFIVGVVLCLAYMICTAVILGV